MKPVAQPKSNPTKIKPEMETKIKPDIDAAAASASAVPKVKAQEPDLPKAGQPEVTPDAGKKVQKPEEVDNPNSDKGISQQTPRVIPGQDGVVTGGSSTKLGKNMMEDMGLSRGQKWTGYQAKHIIPADMADHPVIQKMGMDLDDASNGKFLPVPDSVDTTSVSPLSRHRGYHSTYNEFVRAQLDNIDVNQSPVMLQKEVKELQRKLGILQDKVLPLYPKFGATTELRERFMKNLD